MNDAQLGTLKYHLQVIEQIDTDLIIYGDDEEERKNLEHDRDMEVIKLKYTMKKILK